MADNAKDTEQRKIEKIINALTERKNDVNNSHALTTSKSTITGSKRSASALELPQTAKQKNRLAPKQNSQKSQKSQPQTAQQQMRTRSSTHTRNGNKKAILENDNNESINGENSTMENNSHKMDVVQDVVASTDDTDTVDADVDDSICSDVSEKVNKNNKDHSDGEDNEDDDAEDEDEDDSGRTPLIKKRKTEDNVGISEILAVRDTFVNINPEILDEEFVTSLQVRWAKAEEYVLTTSDDSNSSSSSISSFSSFLTSTSTSTKSTNQWNAAKCVNLRYRPFQMIVLQQFLENEFYTRQLVQEMCQMEWRRKKMDLYEFHQTTDLVNLSYCSSPGLKSFYEVLSDMMLPWMRQVTGLRLTHVSASCSIYNYGDFLLAHDDLLSDRQIAYVFYLSPWPGAEDWTEEMGGALELFKCDDDQPTYPIAKKIPPRNNQFLFFRVCSKSFHQVGEVTNLVYPRLTINGWFHGPNSQNCNLPPGLTTNSALEKNKVLPKKFPAYIAPVVNDLDLNEWINSTYLRHEAQISIQEHIEDKSEASLEMFLIREFYDLLVNEFKENRELEWELQGPANQRKYDVLRLSAQSTGPTKDLYELFTSKAMFALLHQFTELDFDGPNMKRPTCSVQICRFTQGCYTLLGDSSTFAESALDVILFFNAKNLVGTVTYLSPDCISNDTNAELNATTSSERSGNELSNTSSSGTKAVASSYIGAGTSRTRAAIVPKSSYIGRRHNTRRNKSNAKVATFTSEEETGANESSISLDTNEDIESVDTENQDNTVSLSSSSSSSSSSHNEEEEEMDEEGDGDDDEQEEEDDEDNDDDLAHESVLLTIHPKNNALNLVYRLYGQAKFVKYVSKNCIDPNEYVYILSATFKE